jgi:hypothetical protein
MPTKTTGYKISMTGNVIVPEREISEEVALRVLALIMGGGTKHGETSGIDSLHSIIDSGEISIEDGETTPKAFMAKKKPSSEIERITCLAFYLTKYRNVSAFKTKDLTKLNTEAAQPTFSNPTVFARNAEAAGYLAKAGGGSKQISDLGESLVNALPNRDSVKNVLENKTNRKRRNVKKTRRSNKTD